MLFYNQERLLVFNLVILKGINAEKRLPCVQVALQHSQTLASCGVPALKVSVQETYIV